MCLFVILRFVVLRHLMTISKSFSAIMNDINLLHCSLVICWSLPRMSVKWYIAGILFILSHSISIVGSCCMTMSSYMRQKLLGSDLIIPIHSSRSWVMVHDTSGVWSLIWGSEHLHYIKKILPQLCYKSKSTSVCWIIVRILNQWWSDILSWPRCSVVEPFCNLVLIGEITVITILTLTSRQPTICLWCTILGHKYRLFWKIKFPSAS